MTKTRRGEVYAVLLSILESWFPIFTLIILQSIGAISAYTLSILVATIVFIVIITIQKSWGEFKIKEAYKDLLLTTFYITLLFLLVVIGLQYTTAGNMSVIITLQLFFSYLYFNVFGDEKMGIMQTFGAFLMGVGAVIVLFPKDFSLNFGDFLIFLSAVIAPVANVYQKRARTYVSSKTILAFRNIVALPFLITLMICFEGLPTLAKLEPIWWLILLNGILILTISKIMWIEALHLISITKLSALISFIPIFTLIFAYFVLTEIPSFRQMLGIIPILVGGFFITRVVKP
jgi:drug/metabolite transporter (DMT)-like permease